VTPHLTGWWLADYLVLATTAMAALQLWARRPNERNGMHTHDIDGIEQGYTIEYEGPVILTDAENAPHALGDVDRADYIVRLIEEVTHEEGQERFRRAGIEMGLGMLPMVGGKWFHFTPDGDDSPTFLLPEAQMESASLVRAGAAVGEPEAV
jgi:hypothetical protein